MDKYSSDREIKYCAGCGDYAILSSLKKTLAKLDIDPSKTAVISGIGCSSRTPYYLSTWGFNTIHGRAGAIASGLKIARPDLTVFQCTGDGDCLSIGGNHFVHELRRNIDINILLFNNQIYGLTKGQYSPTTPQGQVTKTSPYGTIERKLNAGQLALASGCTFYARTLDKNLKLTQDLMEQSIKHNGTSVLECLTNCVIWNDKAHNREYIEIQDGEIFAGPHGVERRDIHNKAQAFDMLEWFNGNEHPMLLGVIYEEQRSTYEDDLRKQFGDKKLDDIINDLKRTIN